MIYAIAVVDCPGGYGDAIVGCYGSAIEEL